MEQWSKLHILFPVIRKSAKEVAVNIQTKVFGYFGPPNILQAENGREFVNIVIHNLAKTGQEKGGYLS